MVCIRLKSGEEMQFIFLILLFLNCFVIYIPFFTYADEILTISMFTLAYMQLCLRKKSIKALYKNELLSVYMLFTLLILGLLSNFLFKVQPVGIAVVKDIFAFIKFPICYISGLIIFHDVDKEALLKRLSLLSKAIVIILFFAALSTMFIDLGMSQEVRYGIKSFKFFFTHPTFLVFSVVICLCVLIADSRKNNKIFIYLALGVLILSMRDKAFVTVIAYFSLIFFMRHSYKFKYRYILIIGAIGAFVSYDKVMSYLSWGITAARPALYIVGTKIAYDYFPLGSGFGSFASSLSGQYYSPIYSQYNISLINGITQFDFSYMGDVFWPYVYGQLGIFGLILYLGMIYMLLVSIRARYKGNQDRTISVSLLIIYLLIASIVESVFTNDSGPISALVFSVFLGNNSKKE